VPGAPGRVGGEAISVPSTTATTGTAQTPPPAAPPAAAPPTAAAAGQATGGRQGGGRGGRGGGQGAGAGQTAPQGPPPPLQNQPGLYRATLPGGLQMAMMVADVATGEAKELWHPAADDRLTANLNNFTWTGDGIVFSQAAGRGAFGGGGTGNGGGTLAPLPMDKRNGPGDEESPKYYSLALAPDAKAVLLNPTVGAVDNDQAAWSLSKDNTIFYYSTNAVLKDPLDLDRRHVLSMSLTGGEVKPITGGDGIETAPVPLANGKQIAVMYADPKRPMSIGIWPSDGSGAAGQKVQKIIYPTLGPDFPMSSEVVPEMIALKAEDGVEFHNQLFLPKDIKPGEKRAALIFVHGGPQRQMLLGWHYLSFYHVFYGVNQWLSSQGYIVLSVNYRSGTGYGQSFRGAAQVGGRGNSEYRDVLAAGKWLAARPDVDPNKVGIWGLSYGGLLTAEALARNSDIFKAGVDLAGVHLEGNSLNPDDVSYKSSAISEIDNWKSPVLLVQGDDDRNVNFAQMVGLVQLLRARNIYHELIVYPDDVHETLLHKRWLYFFGRMDTFLKKFIMGN
jgi:dienelactone hydrolase